MDTCTPAAATSRFRTAHDGGRRRRVVLTSHDGFGLGHARRNSRIAAAVRAQDPDAEITLVTGLASEHEWLGADGVRVVRVPAVTKDATGRYTTRDGGDLAVALRERARRFAEVVEEARPDVLLVDRHPLGIGGELRPAVAAARRGGAAVVLGLRDILDEPPVVRAELAGPDWAGAGRFVDEVLVYGAPAICDHVEEYGLPVTPEYCGIVTAPVATPRPLAPPVGGTVLVTAGGGGDGDVVGSVLEAVADTARYDRVVVVRGPAARWSVPAGVDVVAPRDDCTDLYEAASASVQMGGYNSTYEAIVSGLRPLLVPRRAPRREQAIRAGRLACLGLADVLDPGAGPDEVRWLLDRPRLQTGWDLARSGLDVDGAARVAGRVLALAGARSAPVLESAPVLAVAR
ncbi:glycosyltransferase family protein [Phycicoccus avicenniae]|uniref:glycosyltransferase family protein n=1 Tax=Phycicoccus avicenniae TaxID=2828860 RepID=UPI003D29AF4B